MAIKAIIGFIVSVTAVFADVFVPIQWDEKYDKKKVALGKELFFETKLSKDKTLSCFSCHFQYGSDARAVSIGVDGKKGEFNAPSVFNSVYNYILHWKGDVKTLHQQFDLPIKADFEMAATQEMINERLQNSQKYVELFDQVYGSLPDYELVKDAVVAFQKTLVTPAKFDAYLLGETKLSQQEKRGLEIFKRYGCATCHNGRNIGGNSVQKFGNIIPRIVDGEELGLKRVPPLRNVLMTPPYFHDGSTQDIQEVIELMAYHNLGMYLSEDEVLAIKSFLSTLTGQKPKTWKTP